MQSLSPSNKTRQANTARQQRTCVVCVHVGVLRAKMPPLEAVHRPQIHLLPVRETYGVQVLPAAIAVPDVYALVSKQRRVGGAADKPQQLLGKAYSGSNVWSVERQLGRS